MNLLFAIFNRIYFQPCEKYSTKFPSITKFVFFYEHFPYGMLSKNLEWTAPREPIQVRIFV